MKVKALFSLILALPTLFFIGGYTVLASSASLTLDLEPSIFRVNLRQDELWASSIRIDNHNAADLKYSLSLIDFKKAENGDYVPILESIRRATISGDATHNKIDQLSSSIVLKQDSVMIKKGSYANIPFEVKIPSDIEPGEYRAAILVSLSSENGESAGSSLEVSSFISSVLNINISGNSDKLLRISNFSTSQSVYESPDVTLVLDIENRGHVRIIPEGSIEIKDIFGKKVGVIVLSQQMMAGIQQANPKNSSYVLNWKPAKTIFGLGPYVATVNLSYGGVDKKSLSGSSMFWILPVRILTSSALIILLLLIIGDRFAKFYIRRIVNKRKNRR